MVVYARQIRGRQDGDSILHQNRHRAGYGAGRRMLPSGIHRQDVARRGTAGGFEEKPTPLPCRPILHQPAQPIEGCQPGQERHRCSARLRRGPPAVILPRPILPKGHQIKTASTPYRDHCDRDTGLKPDEACLNQLGYGQAGLKHYDDASRPTRRPSISETAFQKPRMP